MYCRKLAIIHTIPSKIEPLKDLAIRIIPSLEILHIMDTSLHIELVASKGRLGPVAERLVRYVDMAGSLEVDCILLDIPSDDELMNQVQSRSSTHLPIVGLERNAMISIQTVKQLLDNMKEI